MESNVVFRTRALRKEFGPTVALKGVDIEFRTGEIRGLIGENGSGKSTIMSIASGMQGLTSGEMEYMGKPWKPKSMVAAQRAGISMILQEANTIPGVTVAENIFAGREDNFSKVGLINMQSMYRAADERLKQFGIDHIRARDSIDLYSFEDRKLVELVRCMDDNTQILVVDETTTAMSHTGREVLYRLIHRMAEGGKIVVFISHDLNEILEHCNCLTVLRDGEIIKNLDREEMDAPDAAHQIRYLMVGRDIGEKYYREDYDPGCSDKVVLELKNISFGPIHDFSLKVHEGEIVGIGGLSGCGMHEIGRAAYGLEKLTGGMVLCEGKPYTNCLKAIEMGIGYISKNRDTEALILNASIQHNIALPSLRSLSKASFISPKDERKLSDVEIDHLHIKCGNGRQWVNTLSGGNKQKVSFGKWTARDSKVIIMDCPTRGVDIGVKQTMYAVIEAMKREGKAILMISEELSELIGMVDRLLILKDFELKKEFIRSPDLKETDIVNYLI